MNNELILELLENPSFTEWVDSDFEKHNDEWSAYIDQHPDSHDSINAAIRGVRKLKGERETFQHKDHLFKRIERTLGHDTVQVKTIHLWSVKKFMAYAASVTILLASFLYFGGNRSFETKIGEQLVVTLPDASKVTLNAQSKLNYNRFFWSWQRNLTLEGEAYFDVEKGKKFTVQTSVGDVSVLGTTFNVAQNNRTLDVFCYSGKVSVKAKKSEELSFLTPGLGVVLRHDKEKLDYTSFESSPDWKEGREIFKDASLKDVVMVLEKYFAYRILLAPEIAGQKINADVPISDLDSALQHITWPLGLQYNITGTEVNITR